MQGRIKAFFSRDRKTLYMILSIVLISIFSLTIVYAALSVTLNIQGSGKVNASNWYIGISYATGYNSKTTGSATFTTPTITGTTIADYSVTFTKPGDSVTLYFNIYNIGTLKGEISSIIDSTPICTSSTGNESDASLVCDNLNITYSYENDKKISVGDVIDTNENVCANGSTTATSASILKLVISLNNSMTSVPSSNVTISNLRHEIVYIQTDKECSGNGIPEIT